MTDTEGWWDQMSQVLGLPVDLQLLVSVVGLLWIVTLVPIINQTPLRILVAVPFALFVPGYALIAALFPENGPYAGGIDILERLVLSFGASIALVPLTGLLLNFTPWGIRLVPILVALTALSGLLTIIAARRRANLPDDAKFHPAIVSSIRASIASLTSTEGRVDTVLNIVLLLSICLAAGSVAYAVTVPPDSESFTEFYLLTENESGELVADSYPENMTLGEEQEIIIGIGNHEREPTDYTVITELQRVQREGNQTVVSESRELGRFTRSVAANETVTVRHQFTPVGLTGQPLRLQFQLYRGDGPAAGERKIPYRETHLWINILTKK